MTDPFAFIHDLTWDDIPADVRHQARRCLLDTVGVACGGRPTALSRIIYHHAARAFGGDAAALWFDGRPVSLAGAALAHGMTIDALDLHDSCRPVKGHAGVALVPVALATAALGDGVVDGRELITTLVMAYDIAIRAGSAQHATVCDYHTSGAWNALGCAAIVARRLGLTGEQTRHALGIAEYHGPRSQMMRAIDHPTMVKDGSGWGAMAGVSAGLLAADGFTGAPALTVEGEDAAAFWSDLGSAWSLMIQYFKPYAVCYWAQPALAGALNLVRAHALSLDKIARIEVRTFHEATRLATRCPTTTDEAQYSLPFPLGAVLVHGRLYLNELSGDNLRHPDVLHLAGLVDLVEDDYFNDRFPAERLARVLIETMDGRRYDSGVVAPLWGLDDPPGDAALREKFCALAEAIMPPERAGALASLLWSVDEAPSLRPLLTALAAPARAPISAI